MFNEGVSFAGCVDVCWCGAFLSFSCFLYFVGWVGYDETMVVNDVYGHVWGYMVGKGVVGMDVLGYFFLPFLLSPCTLLYL